MVLNLGKIKPQGFSESVSGVRQMGSPYSLLFVTSHSVWSVRALIQNADDFNLHKKAHFNFPTTKGSINADIELVGFSTSNKLRTTKVKEQFS